MTPSQTKLLEDLRSGAVPASVKPLEWIERDGDQFCKAYWLAVGFGGNYVVEHRNHGAFHVWRPNEADGASFADLDSAKAAAQADYEVRILSALSPSPALVEMIEGLVRERDEARQLAYDLKYAAAGGEDAPGSAHAVTVADVDRWRREQWDVASTDRMMRVAAERERDALREALRRIHNCGQSAEPDHWKFRCMARDIAARALKEAQP